MCVCGSGGGGERWVLDRLSVKAADPEFRDRLFDPNTTSETSPDQTISDRQAGATAGHGDIGRGSD